METRLCPAFRYLPALVPILLAVQSCSEPPVPSQQVRAVAPLSTPVLPTPEPTVGKTASTTRFDGLMGGIIDLSALRGKAVLVVNTASQCGFTGQYEGLEKLYQARGKDGLVIIGVPSNDFGGQEPGSAGEIKSFCDLNYGVTFPMAAKSTVIGNNAHPFYRDAVNKLGPTAIPAWNFHKILVGKDGVPIAAFPSGVTPNAPELRAAIDAALAS
jgi:glutathione peroxidase